MTTATALTLMCEVCRKPREVRRTPNSGRHNFIVLDHDTDEWHIFHWGCLAEPGCQRFLVPHVFRRRSP